MGRAFMEPNRDKLAYFKGVINIITFSVFGYMGLFEEAFKDNRCLGAVLAFEAARELGKMIQEAVEEKYSPTTAKVTKSIIQVGIIYVSWSVGTIAYYQEGNNFLDYSEAALCYIVAVLEALILPAILCGAS